MPKYGDFIQLEGLIAAYKLIGSIPEYLTSLGTELNIGLTQALIIGILIIRYLCNYYYVNNFFVSYCELT